MKLMSLADQAYGYGFYLTSGQLREGAYGICLIGGTPTEEKVRLPKNIIWNSHKNHLGDRACSHRKMSFDNLVLHPNSVINHYDGEWKYTSTEATPVSYLTINGKNPYGVPYSQSFAGPIVYYNVPLPCYHQVIGPFVIGTTTYTDTIDAGSGGGSNTFWLYITRRTVSNITGATKLITYINLEGEFLTPSTWRYKDNRVVNPVWRQAYLTSKLDTSQGPNSPVLTNPFPITWEDYEHLDQRLHVDRTIPQDYLVYGDLVRRAADDARVVPSNWIESLPELLSITQSLKSIANSIGKGATANSAASLFLSYKYGPRLTGLDLYDSINSILYQLKRQAREISYSRARERFSVSTPLGFLYDSVDLEYNYKIYYHTYPRGIRQFLAFLANSGFDPSLRNLWDLVPFSFVVDWLTKTSEHLDSLAANRFWQYYDIAGVVCSKKVIHRDVSSMYLSNRSFTGAISYVSYERELRSEPHQPLYFEATPRKFKNYVDLLSIIVVNTTR